MSSFKRMVKSKWAGPGTVTILYCKPTQMSYCKQTQMWVIVLIHHDTIHLGSFHRKGNLMVYHLAGATIQLANLVNYKCHPSRGWQKVSGHGQEMSQCHTANQPTAARQEKKDTEHIEGSLRRLKQSNQLSLP